MEIKHSLRLHLSLLPLLLLQLLHLYHQLCYAQSEELSARRNDFPPNFIFGAGTSAYQWEGAAAEDGRSPSIWDTFTHAGGMQDKSTGDVAADGYHRYKEDVKLMADTGLDSYRFSISWSRLIPNGRGEVNPKGIAFYNNLIDELLSYGIEPRISLYQLDLPQVLEDEYGGWLSKKVVDDFTAYADVCFKEFGDRVSQWTTLIEPNIIAIGSYDNGIFPPNRCSSPFGTNCTVGNSATEPYIAVHNFLLAHASVVKLYKTKYQRIQKGSIGINVYSIWFYPFSNSSEDIKAAKRSFDFWVGCVLNPVVYGDYPKVMKRIVGSRLPSFTKSQSELLKGSYDFIGLNYYISMYAKDNSNISSTAPRDLTSDTLATFSLSKDETPGSQVVPTHLPFDPAGIQHLLEHIRDAYGNPPTFVEETGFGLGANDSFNDTTRIKYLSSFISSTLDANRNGANVKGFYVWSFVDLFEFLAGYTSRFGLYHVDFETLERRPKQSALWYAKFLKNEVELKSGKNRKHTKLHSQE